MKRRNLSSFLLAVPSIAWFLAFLAVPVLIVLAMSLARRGTYGGVEWNLSLDNFRRLFDPLYLAIFARSVVLALVTSVSCWLIGFPVAYAMSTATRAWRPVLLTMAVLPFWTSFVVRTYALKAVFSETGPINQWLLSWGLLSEPFVFSGSAFAVWLGMVTNYLPLMILPLYVSLEKFDFSLLEAARDLGASKRKQLTHVLIPLTRQGSITGFVFVFAPALGEFVIPDLLGGARRTLIGNLITEQFLKARDWPFGAALSVLLIAAVTVSLICAPQIRSSATGSGAEGAS